MLTCIKINTVTTEGMYDQEPSAGNVNQKQTSHGLGLFFYLFISFLSFIYFFTFVLIAMV